MTGTGYKTIWPAMAMGFHRARQIDFKLSSPDRLQIAELSDALKREFAAIT